MPEDSLPIWAVDLTKQVAILNEKLPNHIEWVERYVRDHEDRLRVVESTTVPQGEFDRLEHRVDVLESKSDENSWLPKLGWAVLWVVVGGVASAVVALVINGGVR